MPYILRNHTTEEIFTCTLINIYDFPYHGTKFWEDQLTAKAEAEPFVKGSEVANPEDWELIEVDEHQLKLFNVKLKNDPNRALYLNKEGKCEVRIRT